MRSHDGPNYKIYEYSPQRRVFFLNGGYTKISLPLPYTVFVQRDHIPYSGNKSHKSLHVGFRSEPLDFTKFESQNLVFPPLPNIWDTGLMTCTRPNDVANFFRSPFSGNSSWAGEEVLTKLYESYKKWSSMSFDEVLNICRNYPDDIGRIHYPDDGDISESTKMKMSIKKIIEYQVHYSRLYHVNSL